MYNKLPICDILKILIGKGGECHAEGNQPEV